MTHMFPEIFLGMSSMFLLFSPKRNPFSTSANNSKVRRLILGGRTVLTLLDLRNRACVSNILRTRMRRTSRRILLLHGESRTRAQAVSTNSRRRLEAPKEMSFRFLVTCRTRASMFLIRTESLLSMYLRLELQRLCRYVLTRRENQRAVEARLKYLILGAFRSGLLLLGLAMIYRRQGTLTFWPGSMSLPRNSMGGRVFSRGMALTRRGLFFKAGRRPFHFWVPDVYQGTPTLSRAYFRTVTKRGILGLLMTLPIPAARLWLVARVSMLLGVLGAIPQSHLKRLFRYSSIAQVGYMCLGLLGIQTLGKTRVVRFLGVYMITGLHRFRVFFAPPGYTTFADLEESTFLGLKVQMRRTFFSLAGIPPLLGFAAKARVLQHARQVGEYGRIRVALLSSVIGTFYSLKVIQILFFQEERLPCRQRRARKEIPRVLRRILSRPSLLIGTYLFSLL